MDIVFVPYGVYVLAGLAMMAVAWLRRWRWWLPIGMAIRNPDERKLLLGIVRRGLFVRFPLALGASLGVLAIVFIAWFIMAEAFAAAVGYLLPSK